MSSYVRDHNAALKPSEQMFRSESFMTTGGVHPSQLGQSFAAEFEAESDVELDSFRSEILPDPWQQELSTEWSTDEADAKLTPHFSLREFASRDGVPVPAQYRTNVLALARNLEILRSHLQAPIRITSGYRSPDHNRRVGGARQSQHLLAKAADMQIEGYTPAQVYCAIEQLIKTGKMAQGGMGLYPTFVHYDIRGRQVRWLGSGVSQTPSCDLSRDRPMPPTSSELDIKRAVRLNRYWGRRLGWQVHYDMIAQVLSSESLTPDEAEFARWVYRWQQSQGLSADGIIGPKTWVRLEPALFAKNAMSHYPNGKPHHPQLELELAEATADGLALLEDEPEEFLGSFLRRSRAGSEQALVRRAIQAGEHNPNRLTNRVFFTRHPERQGRKLSRQEPNFRQLSREWLQIRDRIVRPALSATRPTSDQSLTPSSNLPSPQTATALGTLTVADPDLPRFSYRFTPKDLLWTARFIVGEAGGRDNRDNEAVIWAMFNRYALLAHRYYRTFHEFLRAYSTPLQPVLRSWQAAQRHAHRPEFVRTGGHYPRNPSVPKGQLRRHLRIQATPWQRLPQSARNLATRALNGQVKNPVGIASEFASTYILLRHRLRREPTDAEWRAYTEAFKRHKHFCWIGPIPGINQKKNAFFELTRRVSNDPQRRQISDLAPDTVRVLPPR